MAQSKAHGNVRKLGNVINAKDPTYGAVGDNSHDDSTAIQAALNAAAVAGAGACVYLPQGTYKIGTTTLTPPANVTLQGESRESTFINYSGTSSAIDIAGVSRVTLRDFRLTPGSSATAICINIRTTTSNVRWCKLENLELSGDAVVAGQKGIQFVATGPQIGTDNWFKDINLFSIDKPVTRTDTEGNVWSGINIDTWGATAGATAINSRTHAEFMQARIAGIPAGGTGVGYAQASNDNIDNVSVDIGSGQTALNFTGTANTIVLSRTGNTTPVGTIVAGNTLIEGFIGAVVQNLAKSAAAVAAPADTNSNTLATITVPANVMGVKGVVRCRAYFSYTNNANSKTLRIKFGGTTIIAVARTTQQSSYFDFSVGNRGVTNSQVATGLYGAHGDNTITTFSSTTTAAIDTTAAVSIILEVQKATGGDTITLESYEFDLVRP